MEVVTTWIPLYVLSAGIKVFTATVSVITAVALHFQVPNIRSVIQSAKFSQSRKEALHAAEAERDQAREILRTYRQNLESMVSQRTAELTDSVRQLTLQIEERKKAEAGGSA
jgi:C4-dicarboxylate-specific signal transduction histidine kinase